MVLGLKVRLGLEPGPQRWAWRFPLLFIFILEWAETSIGLEWRCRGRGDPSWTVEPRLAAGQMCSQPALPSPGRRVARARR